MVGHFPRGSGNDRKYGTFTMLTMHAFTDNPSSLHQLSLCDFCEESAIGWRRLLPKRSWKIQGRCFAKRKRMGMWKVCEEHGK